jgi:hypothetical protein
MDWLSHDGVGRDALPEWARARGDVLDGHPYEVTVRPEGLVLANGAVATALRWDEVLAPIRLERPRRLLLAAARRPPKLPWLELEGRDIDAIERIVHSRLAAMKQGSYRERPRARPVLSPEEVLASVLAHRALPGAVEIPAADPNARSTMWSAAGAGAVLLGHFGAAVGGLTTAAVGIALGGLAGATAAGALALMRRNARAGRVLVLTPDAFVGGLDGRSVRAVPWSGVGRFARRAAYGGESALEVVGPTGELIARVGERYFGSPLDVIVAVAEAYRRRAVEELA